jgi:DegV family protein with EDD domain
MYNTFADEGATHVFSIHISVALSAVVDMARTAARDTTSVPVTVLDGQQLSLGTGFLVETAAKLAEAGHSVADILSALTDQIRRTRVFAALDTLEFLKRSGRMNRFLAGIGSLLQLKPILTMREGQPGSEKVRTRERALQRVIEMLREAGALERVAIVHTHAPDGIAELRARAAALLPEGDILTMDITPVIGAHIGPGAAGFAVISAPAQV